MKFLNKLQNQRVLIFGGTSGIGFAVAEGVIEYDASVIISGSNNERLGKTAERLRESYTQVAYDKIATYLCDLADEDSLEENIKTLLEVVTNNGANKLNHVVFTAGDPVVMNPIHDANLKELKRSQVVRLFAPIMIAKYLPQYMENSPDSSFTVTSGAAVERPPPGRTLAVSIGASIEGLTIGLAVDLAPIRVNCVAPGVIKTELLEKQLTPEREQIILQKTKTGRLGRPEDTAEAYLFSMKDGFVTGSILKTNGGYLLS
jgi:NAD(P)-dependent dehydrogenase (short-subunit alcohol dehydrogenase family)